MKRMQILNYKSVLIFLFLIVGGHLFARDYVLEKSLDRSYNAADISKLVVNNKHGDVVLKDSNSTDIVIRVHITSEASNEDEAKDMLKKISVEFTESDGVIYATTLIEKSNKLFSRNEFTIDYDIVIPDTKELDIKNYYGDISIDRLKAPGKFTSKYGALYAGELLFPDAKSGTIYVGYGKCEVEKVTDAMVDVEYSKLKISEGGDIDVDSKYSGVRLGRFNRVKINSQFDGVDIAFANFVDADCRYSGFEIEELTTTIKVDCSFGGVKVKRVHSGFKKIDISNAYGSIKLGVPHEGIFNVDLESSFGGITIPDSWGLNIYSDSNSKTTEGRVGSGVENSVDLDVKFGSIKVYEVSATEN